jgi:hypothetical protein
VAARPTFPAKAAWRVSNVQKSDTPKSPAEAIPGGSAACDLL